MVIVELRIPGPPQAKQRPQHGTNRNTFTPRATLQAEAVVGTFARQGMKGRPPVEFPVGVAAEFYMPTRHRADADNLLKLLMDAMNGIVYQDDKQVDEVFVRVHRGVGADAARTEVAVWELD